jgi:hypothetical protein
MKRKTLFNLLMALGLVLALGGGILMARRAQARGPGPQGTVLSGAEGVLSPQDDVSTAFTYQGRLLGNDTPVNGTCDFRFNLYDDVWLTPNLVAGPVDRGSVTVSDGYFSTSIDFGADAFTGEGRQLQILVRCPAGSGSYTTLSPMAWLNPAPYAHSLRPGASISSDTAGQLGAVLYVEDTYSGALISAAFEGQSTQGTGVRGETFSGYGVYGEATASSGTTYGVYGRNATYAGAGVYGESSYSSGTGVRGHSASGPGVDGSSTSGNGVQGSSTSGNGVWGYSTSGYAIYSEGDTHINGDLTWSTRTGYVAVSAAAFRPQDEGYDYTNQGYQLGTSTIDSEYYAHVQLPHGANVTRVTFYWYDVVGGLIDARCRLYRNDMANNEEQQMAEVWSSGNGGDGSSDTSSITYPEIDNEHYSYYLEWVLDSSLWGYGVVITYEYTEPY